MCSAFPKHRRCITSCRRSKCSKPVEEEHESSTVKRGASEGNRIGRWCDTAVAEKLGLTDFRKVHLPSDELQIVPWHSPVKTSRTITSVIIPQATATAIRQDSPLTSHQARQDCSARPPSHPTPCPDAHVPRVLITRATWLECEAAKGRKDRESANAISRSRARGRADTSRTPCHGQIRCFRQRSREIFCQSQTCFGRSPRKTACRGQKFFRHRQQC